MQGMHYLMIIRLEIACLAILVYILVNFFSVRSMRARGNRLFLCMVGVSMTNVIFDMITVYTVNHLDTVHPKLNVFLHVIFIGTLTALLYISYLYVRNLVFRERPRKFHPVSLLPLLLSVGSVALLPLDYTITPYGNFSSGPAAMVAYVCVAVYFVLIFYLLIRYRANIERRPRLGIITSLIAMIAIMLVQAARGEILISSLGIVVINLGFFFTLENADTLLAEQLSHEKKRADAANRSKSDFLANMSHEIRTPINAVLGMNEMILREGEQAVRLTAEQSSAEAFRNIKTYAANVESAGKNLLAIINDILDFSKIEAGKLEIVTAPYRLSSVLNDVCNMISFRAKAKDLAFTAEVDGNLPDCLRGDEVRVRQVMVNLLNNAVKYTEKGQVILTVKAAGDGAPAPARPKDVCLEISVKDTGIGIRKEDMAKLFSKFERVDMERNQTVEGTGLGLAITENLVAMMQGTIGVESEYGKGSVFTVMLPQGVESEEPLGDFREKPAAGTQARDDYRETFRAPGARVLVVDDTEMNLIVIQGLLKMTQIRLDTATSGEEALRLTQENAYDLILMDQRMPEIDGTETLKRIRAQQQGVNRYTSVICLTADAVQGARDRYLREGFTDYLSKPVEGRALEQALMKYLPAEKVLREERPSSDSPLLPGKRQEADADGRGNPVQEAHGAVQEAYGAVRELDYAEAKRLLATDELIGKTLQSFYHHIRENADALEQSLQEGDYEAFTIKVHALKSSARMIGATGLSEKAKRMEALGNLAGRGEDG